ncbi:MAG: succinate dehydrogenase cytochrome b subunit [Planctomycetes bacterium]|nr:succinate dehydrogenase cytochrome b subunit [Planctomycetota bacterium]
MTWMTDFWRSSIGGKATMAVTGLLLFGFVVAHLLGNLQLLKGADAINNYAKMLHDLGPLLWVARIGLLVVFVLHVATAVRLSRANKAARPVAYAKGATMQATMASRSMVLSGLTVGAFVVYHLAHFTFGAVHGADVAKKTIASTAAWNGHDVFAMVTASFANPLIVALYVAAQVVLFLHLSHGVQSLVQTLGFHHGRYTPVVKSLSVGLALAIAGGNAFLALSVLLGIVKGA